MTEREEFEAIFTMPSDCEWTGNGYAATSYNAWETHTFIARFEGWKAARRTTPDREAIIDELCLALWDVRKLTGELSSDHIWTIQEHFRVLKTAPNGEKG